MNPFGELLLTAEDRAKLVEITDEIILAKFEEYEEHLNLGKQVDLKRWKKFAKSGPTTSYLERKSSSPNTKLPQLLMVGPLPGSLDENMFGIVNPTIESMRIKSSYLNDFNAAAVLASQHTKEKNVEQSPTPAQFDVGDPISSRAFHNLRDRQAPFVPTRDSP
ncbi:hypothetical protein PF010_g15110 [Phytophthora fragariae]|uniref:Uncharacterized protein n=1 Tax=Phytophthora fragariae TaxID=53985 RepID=A0A6G0KVX8_9STRA|nr:hypothetical protein PF003_g5993 [Phytophthora fragariae]KAE9099677.1 hypothetical protein PF010_g15110 [Phytophthora fragariae]